MTATLTIPPIAGGSLGRTVRGSWIVLGVFGVLLVVLSIFSAVSGAVVGLGVTKGYSEPRTVQHAEGGAIAAILVREGDHVEEGQALLELDTSMAAAELGVIDSQRFSLVLRATRLEAEKSGDELPQDWTLPIDTAEKRMALADESALFEARRTARDAAQSRLAEQRSQIQEEVTGLTGQQQALSTEIALLDSETSEMETLYAKGLVTISRINGLKRARASLAGDLSQVQASLAGAASRLLELSEQEAQTKNATEAEILDDLRDTQSRLADIDQRRLALAARLERRVIRAPLAGTVHDLNLTGPGSVATPGQTLVTIVPSEQQWFIEAQIAPGQIEQVKAGGDCAVRLLTLDPQATRRVPCKVTYVGAAAETDARTGASYFTLRASLQTVQDDGTQMPAFMPGMTAEVFVETGSRSIMSYLLEPLGRQIERSMREP